MSVTKQFRAYGCYGYSDYYSSSDVTDATITNEANMYDGNNFTYGTIAFSCGSTYTSIAVMFYVTVSGIPSGATNVSVAPYCRIAEGYAMQDGSNQQFVDYTTAGVKPWGRGTITWSSTPTSFTGNYSSIAASIVNRMFEVSIEGQSSYSYSPEMYIYEVGVYVTYDLPTLTITASAGTGGSISPSGSVSVTSGSSQTFTITPNSGYNIANVLVDSVSQGAISTYTFSNVTAAHTISATFVQITYAITSSAGTGGSISPSGSVSVTSGGSQTFTIIPDTGYNITQVVVDGTNKGAISTFTFTNVSSEHTISAMFGTSSDFRTLLLRRR